MRIVIADDGIPFDGDSFGKGPLGGAESCVVWLAEAMAAQGHEVICLTRCQQTVLRAGVRWVPLYDAPAWTSTAVDLFIANRGNKVLDLAAQWAAPIRRLVFWIHNPARYLMKRRYLWRIWRQKPVLVFLSQAHARTYPGWAPGRRAVIPHGVSPLFSPQRHTTPPPPCAAYLSNPHRGLGLLLDLWEKRILPRLPQAELHLFTGSAIMARSEADLPETAALLTRAGHMPGVTLHGAVPREQLADRLNGMRAFCYPAVVEESFCLAAAETQALGLPGVVTALGALPERVINGSTGFVTPDNDWNAFAEALLAVLEKDVLWSRLHQATCDGPVRRWADVAHDFIRLAD